MIFSVSLKDHFVKPIEWTTNKATMLVVVKEACLSRTINVSVSVLIKLALGNKIDFEGRESQVHRTLPGW